MYNEVNITKEDLKKIIYFILMKFRGDPLHRQGTSSKRDLIGGFIERWFNKVAESLVFDDLLKQKKYRVVSDYFLYGNDSEKNAPDILGLETSDRKHFPFSRYDNGTWVTVPGMPRIEVKVLRRDQSLSSVREPQMIDDFYVFIESDLNNDYLTTIFEDDVFNERYFKSVEMSNAYILNDKQTQILPHSKMEKSEKIGTLRLLGTYSRAELRMNTISCANEVSPLYFSNALNVANVRGKQTKPEFLSISGNGVVLFKSPDPNLYLPFSITTKNGNVPKVKILKRNISSIYIESREELMINQVQTQPGVVKIEFKRFERDSKWVENVTSKFMLEKYARDSTDELVSLFDKIVNSS